MYLHTQWILIFFVLFALKKRKGHPKTGHEGRQVQLYSSFNLGIRWRWVVKATPRPLYPREKDPIPFVQDAEWATGPVWTDAENLASTGIRSPGSASRSDLLRWLLCLDPLLLFI